MLVFPLLMSSVIQDGDIIGGNQHISFLLTLCRCFAIHPLAVQEGKSQKALVRERTQLFNEKVKSISILQKNSCCWATDKLDNRLQHTTGKLVTDLSLLQNNCAENGGLVSKQTHFHFSQRFNATS